MKSYTITLQDCFSFAIVTKVAQLTLDQSKNIGLAILDKRIVHQEFSNGIHYNWVPKKIEFTINLNK